MSKIILVRGMAGTGKSTLTNELSKRLKLVVLHKDDIYDASASVIQEHSSRNKLCFDFLFRLLQTVIDADASIILDFGFNDNNSVLSLDQWVRERGGELKIIHCICSNETIWSERLAERSKNPLPNQLITNLSELKEYYRNLSAEYLEKELVLDTVKELEWLIIQAETFVLEQNAHYANGER
ncbi:putative kinase [Paenibacillus sp. BK033]|uniref:AAA family ATPase n=1 Tax=Paenibacillus sp. BK033 TaxID=2512133 RepID=UPI001047912A|nr:ATP-binding protein [Paenibacillus sp. BK033]TCM87927.1 putative kinase [Paenibacillus sp. BK033]